MRLKLFSVSSILLLLPGVASAGPNSLFRAALRPMVAVPLVLIPAKSTLNNPQQRNHPPLVRVVLYNMSVYMLELEPKYPRLLWPLDQGDTIPAADVTRLRDLGDPIGFGSHTIRSLVREAERKGPVRSPINGEPQDTITLTREIVTGPVFAKEKNSSRLIEVVAFYSLSPYKRNVLAGWRDGQFVYLDIDDNGIEVIEGSKWCLTESDDLYVRRKSTGTLLKVIASTCDGPAAYRLKEGNQDSFVEHDNADLTAPTRIQNEDL